MRCDGTFDIECADWDCFNVAATFTGRTTKLHRSIGELVSFLLGWGGTWWAHAGGIYDMLACAEELRRRGVRCTIGLSQSRISSIRCGKLTLRDSWALIPMPLGEAVALIGERTHVFPWACQCGRDCGGYCRIPRTADPDVDEHVVSDVRQLYAVIQAIADHATACGYELRGTIGATAWATARSVLHLPNADLPAALWRRLSTAIKGGRILCGRMYARGPGVHWDLKSAHAASLAATPLPCGYVAELGERAALDALERGQPGVYNARVLVPEMPFPPLPWRCGGRIVYPTGSFTGQWCYPELEAAIERGVTIERVHSAVVWEDKRVLFAQLMKEWFAIRTAVGRDSPLGAWQADLMRTLTGKFGESPEREVVKMHPEKWVVCMGRGACREGCSGRCGAYRTIDRWGEIVAQPIWRPAASGHLIWNIYLTAATRLRQLEGFEAVGHSRVVYGATDSVWSTGRGVPGVRGRTLGAWEKKHVWRDWQCNAPAHYAYTREGVPEVKVAGASKLTREQWERGHAEIERGVATFLEAAREGRGLFVRRREVWTMPRRDPYGEVWLGDRVLDYATGITEPRSADAHRARAQIRSRRQER